MATPHKVLVVEDEAITAMALEDGLPEFGFEVCAVASSADEAIAALRDHRPAIALVDLRLRPDSQGGEMSGIQLAEELWVCDRVPVVFITAYTDAPVIDRIGVSGAFGFVAKPFTVGAVAAALRVALGKLAEVQAELRGRGTR
jgi:CheY-like chemotaxis protein